MKTRLALLGLSGLLMLALSTPPPSVAVPARQALTRPHYEIIMSAAPAPGAVVEMELLSERSRRVPPVTVPGQPHRIGGGR